MTQSLKKTVILEFTPLHCNLHIHYFINLTRLNLGLQLNLPHPFLHPPHYLLHLTPHLPNLTLLTLLPLLPHHHPHRHLNIHHLRTPPALHYYHLQPNSTSHLKVSK